MKNRSLLLSFALLAFVVLQNTGCGGDAGTGTPILFSGDITVNTVWSDHNGSGDGIDYRITGCVNVRDGAVLTIEPGTRIVFESGACLVALNFGAIKAVGTAAENITFTGLQATEGFWAGLNFTNTNNTDNQLVFCVIEYAGTDGGTYSLNGSVNVGESAGISLDPSRLSMQNSTIRFGSHEGIFVSATSVLTNFSNNVITGCDFPVNLRSDNSDVIGTGNDFTGNTKDYVLVRGTGAPAPLDRNMTWPKLNVPYAVQDDINVQATLNIAAGTEIIMKQGAFFWLGDNISQINCVGTAANPIVFRGEQNTTGFWGAIFLDGGASGSFQHCTFTNGGGGSNGYGFPEGVIWCSGYVGNSQLAMINCTINGSLTNGVSVDNASTYNADIATVNTITGIPGGFQAVRVW